jgi:hypothetical protein
MGSVRGVRGKAPNSKFQVPKKLQIPSSKADGNLRK